MSQLIGVPNMLPKYMRNKWRILMILSMPANYHQYIKSHKIVRCNQHHLEGWGVWFSYVLASIFTDFKASEAPQEPCSSGSWHFMGCF